MTARIETNALAHDSHSPGLSAPSIPGARRRRTLRRAAWAIAALGVLLAGGASYQGIAADLDADRYPPPGRLVDVGGFRMHILCTGPEGAGPTLILDHGGGGFGASDWSVVQPQLARFARVCSYDRAGYGWSDPSPAPRTVEPETDELERLLDNAGVAPPYVMVADSLGSYTARLYTTRHPARVVGMVFVDVSTETEWTQPDIRRFNGQFGVFARAARLGTPVGLWRAAGETGLVVHPLVPYLPDVGSPGTELEFAL